ncbi:hypothetical protein T484DRAFT_1858807, partial [Baffinella frigidus]
GPKKEKPPTSAEELKRLAEAKAKIEQEEQELVQKLAEELAAKKEASALKKKVGEPANENPIDRRVRILENRVTNFVQDSNQRAARENKEQTRREEKIVLSISELAKSLGYKLSKTNDKVADLRIDFDKNIKARKESYFKLQDDCIDSLTDCRSRGNNKLQDQFITRRNQKQLEEELHREKTERKAAIQDLFVTQNILQEQLQNLNKGSQKRERSEDLF